MNQSTYQKIVEYSRTKFGVEIAFKDQSWLMKAIGFLLFFNPNFMTSTLRPSETKFIFRQRHGYSPTKMLRLVLFAMS